MSAHDFSFLGQALQARASGALWWPGQRLLAVSDLHLGRAERLARRGGALLPPYDTRDTLARLDAEIAATSPAHVLCLGDSFDDLAAAGGLAEEDRLWLLRLMAGRHWTWIEGNHDPGPTDMGGSHRAELRLGPMTFRHIPGGVDEVAGHLHPRLGLGGRAHPCFLLCASRLILPAFGTYTGGLSAWSPEVTALMGPGALAIITGRQALPVPLIPRR